MLLLGVQGCGKTLVARAIEQAVVSALLTAFSRGGEVTSAVIAEELRATRPLSVTRREEIDRLRAWAADRTVGAS